MRTSVIQGKFSHGIMHLTRQHSAAGGVAAAALPPHLAHLAPNGGQPLPAGVRQAMESMFGTSFADVRVHVGREATAIGATAFTNGSQIHFAPGAYNPSTPAGQRVLAHELAHVVQQRAGRVRNPFGSGIAVVHDRRLEEEADRFGERAIQRMPAPPPRGAIVQRMEDVWGDVDEHSTHGTSSTARAAPFVSFKVKHKHNAIGPQEGTGLTIDNFAKQGRAVVKCIYRAPTSPGRDHHEVMCQIRGLYGKTKYVLFHLTNAGYFSLYNADPDRDDGLGNIDEAVPLSTANTTEKLYALFLRISQANGPYREGSNTCGGFAQEFFRAVTGRAPRGRGLEDLSSFF